MVVACLSLMGVNIVMAGISLLAAGANKERAKPAVRYTPTCRMLTR
jgi:hypothetical protein